MTASARQGIRGALVFLRPLEPEDADVVHGWYEDGEFRRLMGDLPLSRAARLARYERSMAEDDRSTTDAFRFVICRLADGVPVGRLDLFSIDRINGSAGFGIGIGAAEDRGHGYGADAVNALVDFAFGELRLERIWLETDEANAPAQATYRKCGFVEEARRRSAYVDRGGRLDAIRMSFLRDEWVALERRKSWEWLQEEGSRA